ncbi:MAG: Mut7-C RNAse domain-containing protein [Candidatus Omnitrophica bacterium]|nr:Mut7-C RNAse domain-containing protein [Candidatus Omnitrophota bacterium]
MKFILTKELGRLSKWLRILGFDTAYFTKDNMGTLIVEALKDERIILTRRQKMPKAPGVKILNINSDVITEQVKQVLSELKLKTKEELMFSRCIICNAVLEEIEKEKVKNKVPEYVFQTQTNFITCPKCQRIYWQGTHWGNVKKILDKITN